MSSSLRQRRFRKARVLMLWGGASFFVLQIVLGLLFEQCCIGICDPEYALRVNRLRQRIGEQPHKPQWIMFGSSRVSSGFEARLTQELLGQRATVFNFGLTTGGPFLQQVCFDRLRAEGIRPDVVFFEVMPPFFHRRPQPMDQSMLDGSRLRLGEIVSLPRDRDSLSNAYRKYAFGRFLPSSRYAESVQTQLGLPGKESSIDAHNAIDGHGWLPLPVDKGNQRPELIALAHRQYDACYRDFQLSADQVRRMDALIRSAQDSGIRVGLVLMPEGSEFRKFYSAEMTRAITALLERWKKEFGVAVIDGRDWLGDEWFFDMHHLVQTGATTFSNLFQQTLRSEYPELFRGK